ncbi:MAG: DUF554 domain-containing protein [Clostridia bacterium]|nr:DUF554 domain-containing protein [Clostridia bacterium]
MILLGTIVNSVGIAVGAFIGVLITNILKKNKRLAAIPDKLMKAVGLCVIYIGIEGAFKNQNTLVLILSIVIGALIGELIDIDKHLNTLGAFVERKLTKKKYDEDGNEIVSERGLAKSFVSATILFCVGAMAITGAIESGLSGGAEQSTLYAKATLDTISSIVFGATLGIGTALSAICVFIYQGAIELCAEAVSGLISDYVMAQMTAAGSLIIFAIGLNMIGVTKIKVANLLPAIFLPLLLCLFV